MPPQTLRQNEKHINLHFIKTNQQSQLYPDIMHHNRPLLSGFDGELFVLSSNAVEAKIIDFHQNIPTGVDKHIAIGGPYPECEDGVGVSAELLHMVFYPLLGSLQVGKAAFMKES